MTTNNEPRTTNHELYDIVIIGGGPAGFTSGIYAARARMKTLLFESLSVMGQAAMTETIENYPGVEKASGFGLVESFKKQAESFGLKTLQDTVHSLCPCKEGGRDAWKVAADSGEYKALSVIVASGASPKKLGIPGESEFLGKGVSYCATCDGPFFRAKTVVVIGGGDTAVEEALFLAKFAAKVILIHRKDRLRAAKVIQERAFACEKISFIMDSVVLAIKGSASVSSVDIRNLRTGEVSSIECSGVFVFVGWSPNTGLLKDIVSKDPSGAVLVDGRMMSSSPGIFAAGDCTSKILHQVVTACGDGAVAAYAAGQYVDELKGVAYK